MGLLNTTITALLMRSNKKGFIQVVFFIQVNSIHDLQ